MSSSFKKLKWAGVFGVICCFLLMGIAFAEEKSSGGSLPNLYEEKVLKWSFRYPDNWKVHDDGGVVPGDIDLSEVKEASVMILRRDKDGEYHASNSVMITYFSDITPSEWDSRHLSQMGKVISYDTANSKVGLQYAVEKEKEEVIYKQYVVGASKGVVLITARFLDRAEMAEIQPEIEKIARSIQVQ